MKLILHIGMGKTGSSAIQHALRSSAAQLGAQQAEYLGMWFDMLDPAYRGLQNQGQFFALAPDDMILATDGLLGLLKARAEAQGTATFILSNEAFSGHARAMQPMVAHLVAAGVDVQAIGYARDPAAWLPSAYVQWGIRDKVDPGPVPAYADKARKLVRWYNGLLDWHRLMGPVLQVRNYDAATPDIVADFAAITGLRLKGAGTRVLERGEDAEIVLRALYNSRFQKHVLPAAFERAVLPGLAAVPPLETLLDRCFDYGETPAIIAEQAALFERFAAAFGFDPRASGKTPPPVPDPDRLRDRLLDALLEVTLDQARRLQRMEQRLARLEGDGKGSDG